MTSYVVFLHSDNGWLLLDTFNTPSADAAIRAAVEAGDEGAGMYAAVPARSWKPRTVKLDTVTQVKLA